MKSSSIFISLVLILGVQLASSQNDLLGMWSNPMATNDSDPYCCVPTSITIEATESINNLRATYQFPSIFQQGYSAKCGLLFNGNVGGQSSITLYKDILKGKYFIQKYDMSAFSNRNYIFQVTESTLTIQGSGASSSTACNFSMNTHASSSSGMIGLLIPVVIIIGLVAFKNYQKKQQLAFVKQILPEHDTIFSNPNPTYAYAQFHDDAQSGQP